MGKRRNALRGVMLKVGFGALVAAAFLSLIGCKAAAGGGEQMPAKEDLLKGISDEGVAKVGKKRILFGHKSVGYNILNGFEEIRKRDSRFSRINIKEWGRNREEFREGGIFHVQNGKNGFPKDKCDAFSRLLMEKGVGTQVDIACFKFCYVDFRTDANVNDIFDYYVRTIDTVRKEFPELRLIHITVPLTTHTWGVKSYLRNLIKGDLTNVRRNEFNRMLIKKYKEKDLIFDLAAVESTYPDGRREAFRYKGESFFALAKQYTKDGGHLNDEGSYYAARKLLLVLLEAELSIQ